MIEQYNLSTKVTEQTPQHRILVSLSNGQTIIQNDIPQEKHFWKRIRDLITNNKDISITMVRFQIPTAMLNLPPNCPYYYFMNVKSGNIGETCINSVKFGYAVDTMYIHCTELTGSTIKNVVMPFKKGGVGVIANNRSEKSFESN